MQGTGATFSAPADFLPAILKKVKGDREKIAELQLSQHTARMEKAYREASRQATKEMIEYWKSRPTRKPTSGGELVEWQEGNSIRRAIIKE